MATPSRPVEYSRAHSGRSTRAPERRWCRTADDLVYWAAAGRTLRKQYYQAISAGMAICETSHLVGASLHHRTAGRKRNFIARTVLAQTRRRRNRPNQKPSSGRAPIRGRLQRVSRAIIAKGSGMLYRMNRSVPINRKTMRALKSTAIGAGRRDLRVRARMAALDRYRSGRKRTSNPLIAPVPPPAAPAQLPAPVTTAIAPILAPVPTLAIATPTPAGARLQLQLLRTRQSATNWMGTGNGCRLFRRPAVRRRCVCRI